MHEVVVTGGAVAECVDGIVEVRVRLTEELLRDIDEGALAYHIGRDAAHAAKSAITSGQVS
jgi:hypothetical protein